MSSLNIFDAIKEALNARQVVEAYVSVLKKLQQMPKSLPKEEKVEKTARHPNALAI